MLQQYHWITGHWMVATKLWTSSLVCRGRQTTARGGCNVRQGTLQKILKISIKNSKCAVSNKHIQDGRPGRYANRRGSKTKAKHHPEDPTPTQEDDCQRCHHPEGERIRNCASWQQKDRVSAEKCQMRPLCPEDEEWCQRPNWRSTLNCNVNGAYPRALLPFTKYLDDVWSTRSVF